MTLFPASPELPAGRAVLLSIKPRYAELILAGSKTVELRRSWPSADIGSMVLYSSSPVQKLVGIAYIDRVEETDVEGLWRIAEAHGGGVTREELFTYFAGKLSAFGIMIKSAATASRFVDPNDLFPRFTPPQSFAYLTPADFRRVMQAIFPETLP